MGQNRLLIDNLRPYIIARNRVLVWLSGKQDFSGRLGAMTKLSLLGDGPVGQMFAKYGLFAVVVIPCSPTPVSSFNRGFCHCLMLNGCRSIHQVTGKEMRVLLLLVFQIF